MGRNFWQKEVGRNNQLRRRELLIGAGCTLVASGLPSSARAANIDAAKLLKSFDSTLANLEQSPDLVERSRGYREFVNLNLGLETAPLQAEPSNTPISQRSSNLLIQFEVTSSKVYEKRYRSPTWPRGKSGVTVGIGYDIGYAEPHEIRKDWSGYVAADDLNSLTTASGIIGEPAKSYAQSLAAISIPFDVANHQFLEVMQPRYVGITERALPNFDSLPADCRGALVSLVYNRGATFGIAAEKDRKGRYSEMRAIKLAMQTGQYRKIPDLLLSMTRLWANDPDLKGLVIRRRLEATLFLIGLAGA
ncbi:hypothetical protein QD357_11605 [Rhizobium sp. BR 317]|uniref:hypothetical protein n=1 Tax=Rhizobium sp. BR 317 TaxID=3040015 RepID=UPI0039BF0C42